MHRTVLFGDRELTLEGKHREAGDKAPEFTVVDENLEEVSSDEFADKIRIISVFPSIDTSVCALQTKHFYKKISRLGDDVVLLSISADLPFAQKRFCAAEGIENGHVYSDYREMDFGRKYGFILKELRLLSRGIVVIDRKGIIRYIEYAPQVREHVDYDRAMDAVKELLEEAGAAEKTA